MNDYYDRSFKPRDPRAQEHNDEISEELLWQLYEDDLNAAEIERIQYEEFSG